MSKIEHEEIKATLRMAMDQFDAVRDRLGSFSTADLQVMTETPVTLSSDTPPDANTWKTYVITWVASHILEQRDRARELERIRENELRDNESAVIRARQRDTNNDGFDHNWRQNNWN